MYTPAGRRQQRNEHQAQACSSAWAANGDKLAANREDSTGSEATVGNTDLGLHAESESITTQSQPQVLLFGSRPEKNLSVLLLKSNFGSTSNWASFFFRLLCEIRSESPQPVSLSKDGSHRHGRERATHPGT